MSTDLYDLAAQTFQNVDNVWWGHAVPDAAVVPIACGTFVVTPDGDADGEEAYYLLGWYGGNEWEETGEATELAELRMPAANVVQLLAYFTEPPEGVDHAAWIAQRLADDVADDFTP